MAGIEVAVRAEGVVVASPLLDQHMGLAEQKEVLVIQHFVAEPFGEANAMPILTSNFNTGALRLPVVD